VTGAAVVVLTNTRDLAADDVIRRLHALGFSTVRLNADRLIDIEPWSPARPPVPAGVVWWRQFETWEDDAISAEAIDELMVTRGQWRSWLATLDDGVIPWVNPLWHARRAENKIVQLRTAESCGFTVPETIVTNRRRDAEKFALHGASVVKSLSAAYFEFSEHGFVYTRPIEDALALPEAEWQAQPLIVQRRVFGEDARIIVFDEQSFGASCATSAVDWRVDSEKVDWSSWTVPSFVRTKCLEYMSHLGLRYAAFDIKCDGDAVWFLEANQAGEWSFLERSLGLGISEAFAEYLGRLSRTV
jgi:glutathione synthase/RimK-type ligase-like ATP-grasp enzyme